MSVSRFGILAMLLWAGIIGDCGLAQDVQVMEKSSDSRVRADLIISGVRPPLTTCVICSQNGAHQKQGHAERGIGAVVPWADRLWTVNYAPNQPNGSEHKLYSIDSEFRMTIHPESVEGTPAGRMIHRESNPLLIAHDLIDSAGHVRANSATFCFCQESGMCPLSNPSPFSSQKNP